MQHESIYIYLFQIHRKLIRNNILYNSRVLSLFYFVSKVLLLLSNFFFRNKIILKIGTLLFIYFNATYSNREQKKKEKENVY